MKNVLEKVFKNDDFVQNRGLGDCRTDENAREYKLHKQANTDKQAKIGTQEKSNN